MNQHHEYRRKSDAKQHQSRDDLHQAQLEVEQKRHHVEYALNQLEGKFQDGLDRMTGVFFKSSKPFQLARENPLVSASLFMIAGFALGAWITRKIDSAPSTTLAGVDAMNDAVLGLKTEQDLGLGFPKSDRVENP